MTVLPGSNVRKSWKTYLMEISGNMGRRELPSDGLETYELDAIEVSREERQGP